MLRIYPPRKLRSRRHGGAILEMLISLPVLAIGLFGVVEFAILQSNQQQLEAASRLGARMASEWPELPVATSVPPDIVEPIRRKLQAAQLEATDGNIRITVEHNLLFGPTGTQLEAGDLDCPAPAPLTAAQAPAIGRYVRVTVCMDIVNGRMAPNLLKTLGFDITGRVSRQTTTFRYDLKN
ncbi:TadE/TadG family type IV pilus assembly protein [Lignipirellula cremea]|uniref:TadE-like protein n=1 Tax=Lignipirellula cremea TaxID=2528010 RepID=A0A518E568_9BACT|nr:TadE family protein [Lignipirellula cremea]QDU99217.1 TadE-like protein [Lignipirellula cremea]